MSSSPWHLEIERRISRLEGLMYALLALAALQLAGIHLLDPVPLLHFP